MAVKTQILIRTCLSFKINVLVYIQKQLDVSLCSFSLFSCLSCSLHFSFLSYLVACTFTYTKRPLFGLIASDLTCFTHTNINKQISMPTHDYFSESDTFRYQHEKYQYPHMASFLFSQQVSQMQLDSGLHRCQEGEKKKEGGKNSRYRTYFRNIHLKLIQKKQCQYNVWQYFPQSVNKKSSA